MLYTFILTIYVQSTLLQNFKKFFENLYYSRYSRLHVFDSQGLDFYIIIATLIEYAWTSKKIYGKRYLA